MPIKIAIIGGSIAGCSLAHGLFRHPHIEFDVFDAKPSFSERGAGVSLALNARKALHALGIDAEAALKRAGAVAMGSSYCMIVSSMSDTLSRSIALTCRLRWSQGLGEHKGGPILDLPGTAEGGAFVVDRKHWLDVLLEPLPKERLHASKKLESISQANANGAYQLHFEDGSTYEADGVIGCDGNRSKVRQMVLGPEHEDKWAPKFGGYWDSRGRTTPQMAAEQFGTEFFDPTTANEIALVGKGAFLLFAPTEEGRVYHVIVSTAAGPGYDSSSWKNQLSRDSSRSPTRNGTSGSGTL